MLKNSALARLVKILNDGYVYRRCSSAAADFPSPQFDWDYLLRDETIDENIRNRKGVGDIQRLRRLVSDSIPGASLESSPSENDAATISSSSSIHSASSLNALHCRLKDSAAIEEALRIPNATHPDVPIGDETRSRIVGEFNRRRDYDFAPKSHLEIGSLLKGLRTENVGATTGKKSYYVMNDVALLERALVKYAVAKLRRAGFSLVSVPDILRPEIIRRCGFETDNVANNAVYKVRIPNRDGEEEEFCLSGTAEMGIAGYLKGRTFRASELPIKIASVSRCFRSEMSTRVLDKGLYRVLQFTKVELFCLTRDDVAESERTLSDLLRLQRDIFEPLGICGRVLEMSTEELGAPAYHKYDIEAWIESRDCFSEISSTSNCTDYQSRRLGFRYLDGDEEECGEKGNLRFCHSLNGTACAAPRLIQTILEHHQLENGEVTVPEVLVPFCRGKTKLELKPDWPVYFFKDFGDKIPALSKS